MADVQEQLYKSILDNVYDGVYMLDTDRKITYWNHGAERITGYGAEEVLGRYCHENLLVHVDTEGNPLCETECCPAARVMGDGRPREMELFLHHKDGHRLPIDTRVSPIVGPEGRVAGAVEIFSDNSGVVAARQRMERLQKLALLDPVTGVGNRRHALAGIDERLSALDRYGWPFSLLMIDIDYFKKVNDEYGHVVGDRVLRMVAMTCEQSIRSFDELSRWGGEEFTAILQDVTQDELAAAAEKLRALVERSQLSTDGGALGVTVSVGATEARAGDTPESLVDRADRLMYESKSKGRNRVTVG